jgi:hypothetical protein
MDSQLIPRVEVARGGSRSDHWIQAWERANAAPGRAVLDQPTLPIGHDDRPGGLDIRWTCDGAYKSSHDISCSRPYVPYVHELEVRDGHVKTDEHIQDLSSQLKGHFASLAPPDNNVREFPRDTLLRKGCDPTSSPELDSAPFVELNTNRTTATHIPSIQKLVDTKSDPEAVRAFTLMPPTIPDGEPISVRWARRAGVFDGTQVYRGSTTILGSDQPLTPDVVYPAGLKIYHLGSRLGQYVLRLILYVSSSVRATRDGGGFPCFDFSLSSRVSGVWLRPQPHPSNNWDSSDACTYRGLRLILSTTVNGAL